MSFRVGENPPNTNRNIMINKTFPKAPTILALLVCSLFINQTNAQGPNAPEAASFEPVDATDMVNLVTGDLSYVLPLLNIPSPEGGYPIALSYHAGIPMDLEASWVGLGWSLNPGAINRNVNGYPDDWGESIVNHFFNDAGWTDTYYDFGIGANIYGINVGVGAYWGSNKTFGGSVSFGIGNVSGTLQTGSRGFGIGGQINAPGFGSLSANISTNGVGVGIGIGSPLNGGNFNLNYGYNSGLSSSASINAVGVSFNSQGGVGLSNGNFGGGISNSNSSVSAGDYAVTVRTKGVNLDLGLFRIRAGRTQVKYDLYKEEFDRVTGILHPFDTPTYGDFSMDIVSNIAYNESIPPTALINSKDQLEYDHLLYAGFDNYTLTAQGLSGAIQPKFIEEVYLYSKSKNDGNGNSRYFNFNSSHQDVSLGLNNRLFFYFKNHYSSFLRINKSAMSTPGSTILDIYNDAHTNNGSLYNSNTTPNGEFLTNNGRKREGNFIYTFTNSDINNLNSQGITADVFIEAKGIDRSNNTFIEEGIGAFQVTATDGKTYHYSLPVYNFELYYKNFNNSADEDEKFYLNTKDTPYATHWLLTAITGPDYFDANRDGELNKGDYGYWVEFEYGKWTDGYIWKGSSGDYDVVKGGGLNDDTYEYYRGRKQIYYLDAIKTRTHTAYFIKSLREDNKGEQWLYSKNDTRVPSSGSYDIFNYTKAFNSNKLTYTWISSNEYVGLPTEISNANNTGQTGDVIYHKGFRSSYKYADFPKHDVLKLDKIILVSNDVIINKSSGNILNPNQKAYYYNNRSFKVDHSGYGTINFNTCTPGNNSTCLETRYDGDKFYEYNNFNLEEIDVHLSQNILDTNDLVGLNIEQYAEKVITFNHDTSYPLVKNAFNSDASSKGRLTLNGVSFGGKQGVQLTPDYTFSYEKAYIDFDVEKEDAWGYHKNHPDVWSLNEIKTPIGTKIKINYESDDFYREAIDSKRVFNNGLSFLITENVSDELLFDITLNNHADAKTIDDFNSFLDYFQLNEYANLDLFICRRSKYGGSRRAVELEIDEVNAEIINVTAQSVTIKIPNDSNFWTFDDQNDGWILNRIFSLTDVTFTNGNSDGVIMRETELNKCYKWRDSYNNDDVSINFQLTTSTVPYNKTEGGLRTKTIEITDNDQLFKTNYYYNEKGFDKSQSDQNYRSSGITSYCPSKEAKAIPYVAELPAPMVMYKYVTVESTDNEDNIVGVSEYEFETLTPYQLDNNYLFTLGEHFKVKKEFETSQFNGNLIANKHTVYNKLNNLGRLLSLEEYSSKGQILRHQENNYKDNLDSHGEIGVYEESYLSKSTYLGEYTVTSTSRVTYPSVLESTTVTQGNFKSITSFNKHDFLTGQVLETITENSKNQEHKTEIIPAYTIPEYSDNITYYGMGSKADKFSNKNMLIQEAMTKTHLKVGNDWKETSVGITTWNNDWTYTDYDGQTSSPTGSPPDNDEIQQIWRKHKSYVWDGSLNADGTYNSFTGADDGFEWGLGDPQTNTAWKNVSTTTQYDHYSMPLEVRDVNNNYASTKTCDNESKVLAISNAAYTEMYYSGAEYIVKDSNGNSLGYFDGQVKASPQSSTYAHTGFYSIIINTNLKGFEVNLPDNPERTGLKSKFKISVWAKTDNHINARIHINGVSRPFNGEQVFAGEWVQLNHYEELSSGSETVYVTSASGKVRFDDFRLHPIASSMTSYVYNEWDELWYIIGNNGLASKFEYDAAGRLIKTYTEVINEGSVIGGFKKVSENEYNYKKQQ